MRKSLIIGSLLLMMTPLAGCTIIDDLKTDVESDTMGLERTVTIYSKDGHILKQYQGNNVRVKYGKDSNVMVVNIDGKRLNIMNADVVVEEKGAEKYDVHPERQMPSDDSDKIGEDPEDDSSL